MRTRVLILGLLAAACGSGDGEVSESTSPPTFGSIAPDTTIVTEVPMEIQDCDAPQITFSTLCEIYELVEDWHVDGPADAATLADAAVEGLTDFQTEETEEPPRTLFCAIPDSEFIELCNEIQRRVNDESIPVGPAVEAAVLRMANTALDPFSYYLPPGQTGAYRSNGVVGGIGVLLDATDAVGSKCAKVTEVCELRIVFLVEDNPGEAAGLQPDDVITAIDGEPVDGLGFVEAGGLIAGDETGTLMLTIRRDGETLEFTIERAELTVPSVEAEVPTPGTGYLRIPDFEADIPQLVNDALAALEEIGYQTLVVDLRDNPGGFVDAAIFVISEFVDGGVILTETAGADEFEVEALEGGQASGKRLIVLVNEGTASAAEMTAMALRDRRNAIILGQTTFGKNAVQLQFDLNNGGEMLVAIADWFGPSGDTVENTGLEPDVFVEFPIDPSVDELIEIALDNS